jgi:hypothetical protein
MAELSRKPFRTGGIRKRPVEHGLASDARPWDFPFGFDPKRSHHLKVGLAHDFEQIVCWPRYLLHWPVKEANAC